jgi:hypothetical protein
LGVPLHWRGTWFHGVYYSASAGLVVHSHMVGELRTTSQEISCRQSLPGWQFAMMLLKPFLPLRELQRLSFDYPPASGGARARAHRYRSEDCRY